MFLGCCLAFVPLPYDPPEDADNDNHDGDDDSGGGSSAIPGFLQDRGITNALHSANAADIVASREDDVMVMGVATLSCLAVSFMLWTLPF